MVEADKVGGIILKSLYRMGRNYLELGMQRKTFAGKGIWLIPINDGIVLEFIEMLLSEKSAPFS
ncbi:MAG: hypothetical protein LBU32_21545 [Clostridiales bacterium]|nr:hypothetical protein [Clostridiales bacterium]